MDAGTVGENAIMSQISTSSRNRMRIDTNSTSAIRINSLQNLTVPFNYTKTIEIKAAYRDNTTDIRLFRDKVKNTRTQTGQQHLQYGIEVTRLIDLAQRLYLYKEC